MNFRHKIVAILNEKLETGKAMNALAHAMLGFGSQHGKMPELELTAYVDAEGKEHGKITAMPIVVLKATPNKIRTIKNLAQEKGLRFQEFVETMSLGAVEEELALMKTQKDEDLSYWALVLFGEAQAVTELTGKLSLYK